MKRIIIVSLILVFLTLGAVSAADNTEDVLTNSSDFKYYIDEGVNPIINYNDLSSDDFECMYTGTMEADCQSEIVKARYLYYSNAENGNFTCYINEKEIYNNHTEEVHFKLQDLGIAGPGTYKLDLNYTLNGTTLNILKTDLNVYQTEKIEGVTCSIQSFDYSSDEPDGSNDLLRIHCENKMNGTFNFYLNDILADTLPANRGTNYLTGNFFANKPACGRYVGKLTYNNGSGEKLIGIREIGIDYRITLYSMYLSYQQNGLVKISIPEDATGDLYVTFNGKSEKVKYSQGEATYKIDASKLDIKSYKITAKLVNDPIYTQKEESQYVSLIPNIYYPTRMNVGETDYFYISSPNFKYNGTLYLYEGKINENEFVEKTDNLIATAKLVDGKGYLPITTPSKGTYGFYVEYPTDDSIYYASFTTNVIENNKNFTVTMNPKTAIAKQTVTFTIDGLDCSKYVFIDGSSNVLTSNKNTISTVFESSGTHHLKIKEYGRNGNFFSANILINVLPQPVLTARDTAMYYLDGYYSVKVKNSYGKYQKGLRVAFKVGTVSYYAYTDANGIAKIKPTQTPSKYRVTATYAGASVKNTITIKNILSLNAVKVKKSAGKLILTAKLAKKYKGKQITFKFNGKTLKTRTNAYGIAKVTVSKTLLSKLKVGQTVAYSATYVKQTVKRTAKVLR